MKKLLLTFLLLFSLKSGFSQFYSFTQLNLPYNNVTGGTVVSAPGWTYYDTYVIPFPFQFNYFGTTFDTFYVAGGFGGFVYYGNGYYGDYQLYFYDAPLIDLGNGISPISYSVTGTAPNRVVILQIENAGFLDDQTQTDYVDLQVWFFESTNVIEIHAGDNSVTNNDSWYPGFNGPAVVLLKDTNTFLQLYGPADGASSSTSYVADFVTGAPSVTEVYRFTPMFSGVEHISQLAVNVFPNPTNGIIHINATRLNHAATLSIFNLAGVRVYMQEINSALVSVDPQLNSGIYVMKIDSDEGQYVQKLVVNK